MAELQLVPMPAGWSRPETGPMQFGEDWPGVFIRGDRALFLRAALRSVVKSDLEINAMLAMESLERLLASCSVGNTGWPPVMSPDGGNGNG